MDTKLHPSCRTVQWPLFLLPGLLKKSEAERQVLPDIRPAPRRVLNVFTMVFFQRFAEATVFVGPYYFGYLLYQSILAEYVRVLGDDAGKPLGLIYSRIDKCDRAPVGMANEEVFLGLRLFQKLW